MPIPFRKLLTTLILLVASLPSSQAYQILDDFVVYDRETGNPIRREDFAGKILVLDFIAHWCEPCRRSSPEMKKMAARYRKAGGNPHGVEVVLLTVNVEEKKPRKTDQFISEVGFDFVTDDFVKEGGNGLYAQLRSGSLPHFSIINGLEGNNRSQWEVVCNAPGFYPIQMYEEIINGIKPPGNTEPNIDLLVNHVSQFHPLRNQLNASDALRTFYITRKTAAPKSRKILVRNSGTEPLKIRSIRITGKNRGDFELTSMRRKSLLPGQYAPLVITTKAGVRNSKGAKLVIRSNDPMDKVMKIRLGIEDVSLF